MQKNLIHAAAVLVMVTGAAAVAQLKPAPPRQQPAVSPAQVPEVAAGDAAFQAQDWQKAVDNYVAAQAKGVNHALLEFRLGYALHMLKRYDEALGYHLKAAQITHPALRVDALYNAACAYALLGKKDDSLRFIQYTIDAGFIDAKQVGSDPDLDSLRDDERFRKLIESIGKVPRLHEQLDFMLGTWTAINDLGQVVQTRTLSRPMPESHAIVVTTTNVGGGKWAGLLLPNPAERRWTWTEADAIGTTMAFTGAAIEPAGVRFDGRQYAAAGAGIQVRLTFTPNADGTFTEKAEVSEDGKVWRTHHEEKYTRQVATPAPAR